MQAVQWRWQPQTHAILRDSCFTNTHGLKTRAHARLPEIIEKYDWEQVK